MSLVPRPARAEKTLNLIFVHQPRKHSRFDLEAIALKITAIAPEIKIFGVLPTDTADVIPEREWSRPTITVSFGHVRNFIPRRGPVYENRFVPKLEQFKRFRSLAIDTPVTAPYVPGTILDPATWGPFVMLKPSDPDLTSTGQNLFLFRTTALSGRRLPADHPSQGKPFILQQWIDTGEYITSYRCLTLFGAVMYGAVLRRADPRPGLDSPDAVIESMPAESDRGVSKSCDDPEILAFGARMAEAFPRHPILGCDLLREAATGKLYAIEVNAGGNVWHFSSPRTGPWRTHDGTEKLKRRFSSFDVAAAVLARKTREEAR